MVGQDNTILGRAKADRRYRQELSERIQADPDGYEPNRDMGLYCARMKNFILFPELLERHGLRVLDNTPEEVVAVVTEMLDRIDGTMTYSAEDERLQQTYAKATDPYGFGFSSRVSRTFLRTHPELLADAPAE
ncbi:MAG: hypothetical protein MI741_15320 [Rhodospirillales bacterium]|nr:hypothetical protein [Rhodospirillales bacterium]